MPATGVAGALAAFRSLSSLNGEQSPTDVEYVQTTAGDADELLSGTTGSVDKDHPEAVATPALLVVGRGQFDGRMAKVPGGVAKPTGTVLVEVVSAASGQVMEWGISDQVPPLARLGTVVQARN